MPLFIWDSEMTLGIPSLDAQHHVLVEMVNKLYDEIRDHPEGTEQRMQLWALLQKMEEHFQTEESLFDRTTYPAQEDHKAEHAKFREEMGAILRDSARKPEAEASVAMLNYLVRWFASHLVDEDQKYVAHLQANGVG